MGEFPSWLRVTRTWQDGDRLMLEARVLYPVLHTFPTGCHCSECRRWVADAERHDHPWLGAYICGWCGATVTLHDTPRHKCVGPTVPLAAKGGE